MSGGGQRGTSPVAASKKPKVSKRAMTVGLGVAVCGVAGVLLWKNANPPEEPAKERLPAEMGAVVPYSAPKMMIPPQPPVAATPVSVSAPPLRFDPPKPPPAASTPTLTMPARDPVTKVTAAAVPPVLYPTPHMMSYAAPPAPPPGNGGRAAPGAAPEGGEPASGVVYAASKLEGVQAGLLGDQTFLLTPGLLPCVMDTAIDSTFAGPVECHIPADVKPHGVTLLDRGSVVHGWYKNDVQTGQSRLFVQADWVEDKATGCFIKFDNAPVSDSVGRAGIPGNVDPHYLERFGAAMLLTVGQSGESLAQAALSKGGNTYLSFNGGSGGLETIASAILRKQIEIPPTITVHQGTAIAVFVTKPLDFSPCYSLKLKGR